MVKISSNSSSAKCCTKTKYQIKSINSGYLTPCFSKVMPKHSQIFILFFYLFIYLFILYLLSLYGSLPFSLTLVDPFIIDLFINLFIFYLCGFGSMFSPVETNGINWTTNSFRKFFLGWSLRNLNYTKFNKVITWIFATIISQVNKESKIVVTSKLKKI